MNEKLLAAIRKLLGDKSDELTDAQIEAAFKGTKFVDLTDGEYVGKEKFEAEAKKAKDAATELADFKAANSDDKLKAAERDRDKAIGERDAARTELEAATGKVTNAERADVVREKAGHLPPKLQRLLRDDASKLVTDEVDFAAAVEKLIAEDDDYKAPADDGKGGGEKPAAKVKTGEKVAGQGGTDEDDAELSAFKRGAGVTDDKPADK